MMINNGPGAFIALFTDQVLDFGWQPGQLNATTGPTPPVTGIEYTLSGGGLSELFVTTGTLSGPNVTYLINPHSKRTN